MNLRFPYRTLLLLLLIAASIHNSFAQQDDPAMLRQSLEKYIENTGISADLTDIMDQLLLYRQNPLNLNDANADDILGFPLFSPGQARALLEHRRKYGRLHNLYELQVVPGFDPDFIRMIMPFVSTGQQAEIPLGELLQNAKQELLIQTRIEQPSGMGFETPDTGKYAGKTYPGSEWYRALRFRGNAGSRLSWSLNTESDAGERNIDFISGSIQYSGNKIIKNIIIGDYQANFGQGLVFGTGLSFFKSANALGVVRIRRGLRPYRGLNENEFLRGAATEVTWKNFRFTAMGAHQKLDAGITEGDSAISNEMGITGFVTSGLHRTAAELARKHSLTRTVFGSRIAYQHGALQLAMNHMYSQYNPDKYIRNFQLFSQELKLGGLLSSAEYSYSFRNLYVNGEAELRSNGTFAIGNQIHNLLASLAPNLDFCMQYRNIRQLQNTALSNPPGNLDGNNSEQGIYSGFALKPGAGWQLNAYTDYSFSPSPRYLVSGPSRYTDHLLSALKTFGKYSVLEFRYRYQQGNRNLSNTAVRTMGEFSRQNFRINADFRIHPSLSAQSRVETIIYKGPNGESETGILTYQEFTYKKTGAPWSLIGRYSIFQTDGYNSRLYAYENDVLYNFTIRPFYDKGTAAMLLFRTRIGKSWDLWLKGVLLSYLDRKTNGSGMDMAYSSDSKYYFTKIQIRYKF